MARLGAWVQASRPLLQIRVAAPLVYGQALAFAANGTFRWDLFVAAALFGLLDQLFIVYANDVADDASDRFNTTYNRYTGGSRVIAEGKLGPVELAGAATVALLAMAAVCAHLVFHEHRVFMVVLAAIAAHLLWMYSFPPFRLSYRGAGELVQGVGLGIVLPLAGYYIQAGTVSGVTALTLLPGFLLGYASNVTAALGDAPSDAATGKRTLPVRRGEPRARRTSLIAIAIAILLTPIAAPFASVVGWILTVAVGGAALYRSVRLSPDAESTDRVRCERFTGATLATIAVVILSWSAALVLTARR